MANLTITTSQVLPGTGADVVLRWGYCGEVLTPGEPVYLNSSDGRLYAATADGTEAQAEVVGIALCETKVAAQPVVYQTEGTITIGAAASVGDGALYVLALTAGAIGTEDQILSGDYVTYIGTGNGSNGIDLQIHPTRNAHA